MPETPAPAEQPLNGYVCFYKERRIEVYAATTLAAQTEAARIFKAKKAYQVTVVLAELGTAPGQPVVHIAVD